MTDLLARFVSAFKTGIAGELAAMRASAEASEIALVRGEDLGALRYAFDTVDRVTPGSAGFIKATRVVIERVVEKRVTLRADSALDLTGPCPLVVAPWFLYERLSDALDKIETAPLAMTLFGKQPPKREQAVLLRDHDGLNASQRAAVQLCAESELAFIWGPPGTGKTATLVHVVEELLAKGERLLIASTTNAAIDQLLAQLATRPDFAPGVFVRLGRSDAETYGAELADIVEERRGARREVIDRLRRRIGDVEQQQRYLHTLVDELAPALTSQQSLFAEPTRLRAGALIRVFSAANAIAELDAKRQQRVLEVRIARLDRVRGLSKVRLAELVALDRDVETRVVAEARVILCTLTNTYLAPQLADQRFDTLVAEEASMATLPPLFYAASLCDKRAIMVGDPRQLPPIVQSDDPGVRRAIGRNVFEVTVADPLTSPIVAMLEVQYRMHPQIGALVGSLFYSGRLVHEATGVEAIAAREPFAGRALVVENLVSTCAPKNGSRINLVSAERIAELAHDAVRGGSTSIGVITPYAAQAAEIRRLLGVKRIGDAVECSTIHRFQGRECDVVLVDLVDASPMRPSLLVSEANLLNVSISRARGKLVIVADVAYFERMDPNGLVTRLLRAAVS